MKIWFTADTHFGHANIIKYCGRPFKTITQMDETIIKNWNERIKPDDVVVFLGDFCFKNTAGGKKGEGTTNKAKFYLDKLNGKPIFIRGNHDSNNSLNTHFTALEMEIGGHLIYCIHDPVDFDSHYAINLCGHVHEHWKIKKWGSTYLVNIGVDVWNFKPISIDEILKSLSKFKKELYESAKCNSCGCVQDANLGFECKKCGEQTFTKKEEKELVATSDSKFVPLETTRLKDGR